MRYTGTILPEAIAGVKEDAVAVPAPLQHQIQGVVAVQVQAWGDIKYIIFQHQDNSDMILHGSRIFCCGTVRRKKKT